MAIIYDGKQQIFHLMAGDCSYVMQAARGKYLLHLYWGKRLKEYRGSRKVILADRGFSPNPEPGCRDFSLDTLPQEYPQYGNGDFRSCAYGVQSENGSRISDLSFEGFEIENGKPSLPGLPASFGGEDEVQTLKIHLSDRVLGLRVCLLYSAFEKESVITRSVLFENASSSELLLTKMLSMSVDIREDEFDVLTLYGAHNNERNMDRRPLTSGSVQIESLRGASSPHQAPFMALLRRGACEDSGEIFAANFVYSGNFLAQAQVDSFQNVRFQMGMNPWNGEWLLAPGESFQTPEVVMAYSSCGLNELSHTFHQFYLNHLMKSPFTRRLRPILLNNWEATYFQFNEETLLALADRAVQAGIELFVLDDGWFGRRDDDTSSLGDWFEDKRKLPHGLKWLSEEIHKKGLQFGLWFEPEMISENSELYRAHPDYVLHTEGRPYTYGRGQLVLDLSRPEVCAYVLSCLETILSSVDIDYVKWDMNRHLTEVSSAFLPARRQGEVFHRYVLGLYSILDRITGRFPDILFESCSSGGGRFDPGMLYYMPQTWCSDNTDAVCRMKIQYSTSLTYPAVTIGAHVSAVPNHQTGRVTPLKTRGLTAMSANLGYELNLLNCPDGEIAAIREQTDFYKQIRPLIQFGRLYRLRNPFEGNLAQWNFVSEDKSEAAAFHFEILSRPAASVNLLKLRGLDADALYQEQESGEIYSGAELMYSGLSIPLKQEDFRGECFYFKRVGQEEGKGI